jgi:cell division protein FtsQ
MKKLKLQILLYTTLTIFAWMIVGLASARQKNQMVTSLRPVILNQENNHFLGMDDVKKIVRGIQQRPIEECKRGEVKIAQIEEDLQHNPYVKQAEAYTDIGGNVVVELELRKPLARVMYEDGEGFYVDQEWERVDLSRSFSANTILIRGLPRDLAPRGDSLYAQRLRGLKSFLGYVDKSEFLRSQISELVVRKDGELVIYPEVGDVVIEFGQPVNIADKFQNLELFYHRVLNHVGWSKYKSISLKYTDQIVARK